MTLSLEEKIGQMLGVGFVGLEMPDHIREWLAEGRIGAIVLFARNVASPSQLAELTQSLREAARHPLLISVDQEGGRVARLRAGFTESPGAMALGAANDERLAESVAGVMGAELRALGINWNLAPVVDIAHNAENAVIGTRALGADAHLVAPLAAAQIRGYQAQGVAATAKHFPGHGNTPTDTHVELAVVSGPLDYLWQHDLVPFRAAVDAGVASVMVSHVKFEALDAQHPATLSEAVVLGLLRDEIGFDGLACTDCMEMRAIRDHYGVGESAVLAALAGQDLMFFSHTRQYQEEAYHALLAAARSGRLSAQRVDESASRVNALAAAYPIQAPDVNIIRRPEHLTVMQEAARAGTTLLRADADVFPLRPGMKTALIEFASALDSEAMDRGEPTGFTALLHTQAPHVNAAALPATDIQPETIEQARQLASQSDLMILTTRSVHLWPDEVELARDLIGRSRNVILICLGNPYDADALPDAGTILCTCGDSAPSLQAAVDALLGHYAPTGKLPVPLALPL